MLSKQAESDALIAKYNKNVAGHYSPMKGIVLSRARDIFVESVDGRLFVDFFASYAVTNQGRNHPEIVKAGIRQMLKITSTSGAYYNETYPQLAELISKELGYEKMLPCNGGAEAVECAIKMATRIWHQKMESLGLEKHDAPSKRAVIVGANGSYHGQSGGVWWFRDSVEETFGFEPANPNRDKVKFGRIEALKKLFEERGGEIAAFLVEPIQGEGGVVLPHDKGYLKAARDLCTQYGITMIVDEIQTGLGRTGKMLAQEHDGIRGDIVTIAKALSGGISPVSLVLANDKFPDGRPLMSALGPGDHGSTFGGNPLACAIAIAAINVIRDEKLCQKSAESGKYMLDLLHEKLDRFSQGENPILKEVRGLGLFFGIEFKESSIPFRNALLNAGILCKQSKENTLRITPPLTMPKEIIAMFVDTLEQICEARVQGKDLNKLAIPMLSHRVEKELGLKPDFNDGSKILTDVIIENVEACKTKEEYAAQVQQGRRLDMALLKKGRELVGDKTFAADVQKRERSKSF